jgi:hypothetical protein
LNDILIHIILIAVLNSVVSPMPPSILFWIMGGLFLLGGGQKATHLTIGLGAKPAIILVLMFGFMRNTGTFMSSWLMAAS